MPPDVTAERFQAFSGQHWALIALTLVGCAAMVALGRSRRGRDDRALRRTFAALLTVVAVPLQVILLLPSQYDLATSLPLHVCDLAWIVAAYALWTDRTWATSLTYFWGLTLVPQAILTPSLDQAFPDPRWLGFWGMHLLIVWAAVYLVASGHRPDWRGYRTAVALTALWAGSVMVLNATIATNYGYLNGKPATGSALDLLGPWPWYVVVEVLLVAAVWALMTWPWVRRRRGAVPEGSPTTTLGRAGRSR